jgi:hypothetical protein
MQPEDDADGSWVSELSGTGLPAAAKAIQEAREDRALFRYLERQHVAEGRTSYVEIDAPFELYALARLLKATHVVEVGVSSGVSSAYLLRALQRNGPGTLHSIDLPSLERPPRPGKPRTRSSWSLPPGRLPGWAVPPGLRPRWDLRLGDKADVIPFLAEQLRRIDLLLYDVPHECSELRREIVRLEPLLRTGAVVIIDHGPGGGICPAITGSARAWGSRPHRREGLGLSGTRRVSSSRPFP